MAKPDPEETWRTYSSLWQEVQLPRGALDHWVHAGLVRWLSLSSRTRGDLSFLEGHPDGMYFCWGDIEPLWEDLRANDAQRRLGDTDIQEFGLPKALHPGPFGWLPQQRRR